MGAFLRFVGLGDGQVAHGLSEDDASVNFESFQRVQSCEESLASQNLTTEHSSTGQTITTNHNQTFLHNYIIAVSQVTFIYIVLYTIQIVSKQLHINKQKKYSVVNVVKFINYEMDQISSALFQLSLVTVIVAKLINY